MTSAYNGSFRNTCGNNVEVSIEIITRWTIRIATALIQIHVLRSLSWNGYNKLITTAPLGKYVVLLLTHGFFGKDLAYIQR